MLDVAWHQIYPRARRWGTYGSILYHGMVVKGEIVVAQDAIEDLFMPSGLLCASQRGLEHLVSCGANRDEWKVANVAWSAGIPWADWGEDMPTEYVPKGAPEGVLLLRRASWRRVDAVCYVLNPRLEVEVSAVPAGPNIGDGLICYAGMAMPGTVFARGFMDFSVGSREHYLLASPGAFRIIDALAAGWFRGESVFHRREGE